MKEDMRFVRDKLQFSGDDIYNNAEQKPRTAKEKSSPAQYFRRHNVDRELIMKLYEIYKLDWLAFGYDFEQFLFEYDNA